MAHVVGQPLYVTWDGVQAGQTWTVTAAERDGSTISISPTFTDLEDGRYRGVFTPSAAGVHSWRVASNLGLWETFERTVITAAQADPAAALAATVADVATLTERLTSARALRLDLITTGRIVIRQQIELDGAMRIRPGDAYLAANNRQYDLTTDGWADLDGAVITFAITQLGATTATISKTVSMVAADDPTMQTVRIELTADETALLDISTVYRYDVTAILSGGAPAHLAGDSVTVLA